MNIIGIYKITNTENGMVYVGQSRNVKKRWAEHKRGLRKGTHENDKLQKAYNKYGDKSFVYEVIETCSIEELNEKEIFWCNELQALDRNKGYNLGEAGGQPMLGRHHTLKSRKKMSEYRKIHSIGKGNGFYGKKHTKETLAKISKALKGKVSGERNGMFGKCGELNPFFGKHHSSETRKKMRENHADFTGAKHPKAKFTEDDVKHIIDLLLSGVPTKQVASDYNVSFSCIAGIRNHKNWTYLTNGIIFPNSRKHRLVETTISLP
jgi:group I intron endonuclease